MQNSNSIKINSKQMFKKEPLNKARAMAAATGCGLILLTGFFFAGHQHFSSMDYGIRNSRLRKQLDDLRAEKQRLLYTREVSQSPNEIKKAAKKAGVLDRNVGSSAPVAELASVRRNRETRPSIESNPKPTVIKTASVTPVTPKPQRAVEVVARNEKVDKRSAR